MSDSYEFEQLEHFTAGTVGPKGQRVFYLQFGNPGAIVSLKMEKQQLYAMAEFLIELLSDAQPIAPDDVPLALELIEPIEQSWVVASIGVAHRSDDDRFILVIDEFADEEAPGDAETGTARLTVTPGQVQAFVNRSRELISSGRPPCDFCGRPIDGDDGWCPCQN